MESKKNNEFLLDEVSFGMIDKALAEGKLTDLQAEKLRNSSF